MKHKLPIKLYPLNRLDDFRDSAKQLLREVAGKLKHSLDYDDICKAITDTEIELKNLHCLLRDATGVQIVIDGTKDKPRAYKYSYEAVQVTIVRDSHGWCIKDISRTTGYPDRKATKRKVFYPKDLICKIGENLKTKLLSI